MQAPGHKEAKTPEAEQHMVDKLPGPCKERSPPASPSTPVLETPLKASILSRIWSTCPVNAAALKHCADLPFHVSAPLRCLRLLLLRLRPLWLPPGTSVVNHVNKCDCQLQVGLDAFPTDACWRSRVSLWTLSVCEPTAGGNKRAERTAVQ